MRLRERWIVLMLNHVILIIEGKRMRKLIVNILSVHVCSQPMLCPNDTG